MATSPGRGSAMKTMRNIHVNLTQNTASAKKRSGVFVWLLNTVTRKPKQVWGYPNKSFCKAKIASVIHLSWLPLVCSLEMAQKRRRRFSLHGAKEQSIIHIFPKSILQTLAYFCGVEVLAILFMKRKIYKLQIVQLMSERQRNQPLRSDKKFFWGWTFVIGFSCYTIAIWYFLFCLEWIIIGKRCLSQ